MYGSLLEVQSPYGQLGVSRSRIFLAIDECAQVERRKRQTAEQAVLVPTWMGRLAPAIGQPERPLGPAQSNHSKCRLY